MRRAGTGRRSDVREMYLACPLVAPESAPRFPGLLAGRAGRLPPVANCMGEGTVPACYRPGTALFPPWNCTVTALEPRGIPGGIEGMENMRILRHCNDPQCGKCAARDRWNRRKGWRSGKVSRKGHGTMFERR